MSVFPANLRNKLFSYSGFLMKPYKTFDMQKLLQTIRIFILSFILYSCNDSGSESQLNGFIPKDSVETDLNTCQSPESTGGKILLPGTS